MILVTGASGFVGGAILAKGCNIALPLRAAVRRQTVALPPSVEMIMVNGLAADTDWCRALQGVEVVVHAAARVHVMQDSASDPLAEFRRVNVAGTLSLARQAAQAGVRRFVFISSIKVNGMETPQGQPFTADDLPTPVDAYGISKFEAEEGLKKISKETGIEFVIIRPPLVYGPGVKGNFLSMIRWLQSGIPLPLGAIHNRRSLVALDNLVDLIMTCIWHPNAANQIFLVSDGEDTSTTELLRRTSVALGKLVFLLPVSEVLLCKTLSILGKASYAQRLCGSLQVDIVKTCEMLSWSPVVDMDAALVGTVQCIQEELHSL